jgi:Mg-chelatase subunit ChlD
MATKKKASKKAKKSSKKTYIAMVIDRSGSMSSIHKQTVDGINEQFGALRRDGDKGGDTEVTLIQFDDKIDTVFDGLTPGELVDWNMADFQPRGWTAMYDGIWSAINTLKAKEETDDTGFLVCVISDGEENRSTEITQQLLSDEIKRLQDTGKWTFTYMLANVDIHKVSVALNVPISNIATYTSNAVGSSAAYTVSAGSSVGYLNSRGAGATSTSTFFSDEDKKKLAETK